MGALQGTYGLGSWNRPMIGMRSMIRSRSRVCGRGAGGTYAGLPGGTYTGAGAGGTYTGAGGGATGTGGT